VHKSPEQLARKIEVPLLIAALLTIPAIAIEESTLGQPWDTIGTLLNSVIWLAFLGEIIVMLRITTDRGAWLRRHPLEVAIVVLTPPFLPAALQAARVFRLLRVLRLIKAGLMTRRLLSTEGVRDAAVLAVVAVLGGGAAFAAIEKTDASGHTITAWDGVWWAMTTVTTVGYGDYSPRTDAGRAIAIVVMLAGIGFVAVLTAAAADRFMRSSRKEDSELGEVLVRLDSIAERLDAMEQRQVAEPAQ
jgi:voltage-gated potassium channel